MFCSYFYPVKLASSAWFNLERGGPPDCSSTWAALDPHPTHRRKIVPSSVSHPTRAAHVLREVVGADRLLGRTQAELADAMTWLAWYASGVYTAVMDYLDHVNGEFTPAGR